MNDKAILRAVDVTDTKTKPNFKELCKKFENLSGNENGEVNEVQTPVVPARRAKCASDKSIKRRDPVLKNNPGVNYRNKTDHTPKRPISVKERSKLFETNDNLGNNRNAVLGVEIPVCQSPTTNDNINFTPSAIPPAKPPRVFANLEAEEKPKPAEPSPKSKNGDSIQRTSSLSFEKQDSTARQSQKGPRLMSAPEITSNGESSSKCTNVVQPELPPRRTYENRVSVRNMIYSSFAELRTPPKDNQNVNVPVSDGNDSDVSMKAIEARIIYVKSIKQVSGSSICIAPKLYDALFIINISDNQPEVTNSFPLKVPDAFKYPLLPHICFPDAQLFKVATVYQCETFHFTLYDKGEKVLGYCLRITGWPENSSEVQSLCTKLPVAICILSRYNAPVFYKKLLNEIEKHLTLPREKCFKYIRSLQKLGVPNAGANVSIPDFTECSEDDRVVISRPLDSHIVGSEITRTLQLLDVNIMVKCVASMLLERRVLFFSSSSGNLYNCCKALSSLLYPFDWPHMFIPVLPSCLTVHCCSELPYVLGLLSNNYNSVLDLLAEHELLIIDVDKGTIVKSCNDEDTILPKKIQRALITALNLAKNMTDPTEMLRDTMICEAFVHMFVEIVGHYENHIAEQNNNLTFQKEAFLKNAFSYSIQIFLQWFSETQMFDAFVSESLWRENYRKICQTNQRTFFEKRVDEYKWELTHNGEKFSRFIGRTFKNFENFGEMIIHKLKK